VPNLRLYRAAFIPAIPALLLLMFSLQSPPEPLRASLAPDGFDVGSAASQARNLIKKAPDRQPGSEDDDAAAQYVVEQFQKIEGAEVAEQRFKADFDGDEVDLRNISMVLAGESDRTIALIAHRDTPGGSGVATSAAATGALLELADDFGGARHNKTLLFVSTDGAAAGAAGVKTLARNWPGGITPETAIVLDQPAAAPLRRPFVRSFSDGPQSGSAQLERSAASAVTEEAGDPGLQSAVNRVLRLAVPTALGEEAHLIEEGIDAVGLSSAGELPLDGRAAEQASETTLEEFGRATLSLLLALDSAEAPLDHGPDTYTELAGNLVPGWTLSLIALLLLLPVGVLAVDAVAGALRRGEPLVHCLTWVAGRSFPFLAGLAGVYLLSLVGLIPRPPFPFDPAREGLDAAGVVAILLLLAAFGAIAVAARPLLLPRGAGLEVASASVAAVLFVVGLGLWALNPYLTLLFVPSVHLWTLAGLPGLRLRWLPQATAIALGLALPLLAAGSIAGQLGVGLELPWTGLVMVADGQIGPGTMFLLCLWAGCGLAAIAVAFGVPRGRESTRGEMVEPAEGAGKPFEVDELDALAPERLPDRR
jgi:hypothetical protein